MGRGKINSDVVTYNNNYGQSDYEKRDGEGKKINDSTRDRTGALSVLNSRDNHYTTEPLVVGSLGS